MVAEMSPAESLRMSQTDRKRPVEQYVTGPPTMSTTATQTSGTTGLQEVKRPRPAHTTTAMPTNNGWGDLFKDRQTFLEMHLC